MFPLPFISRGKANAYMIENEGQPLICVFFKSFCSDIDMADFID